jgi:hypothetical protein
MKGAGPDMGHRLKKAKRGAKGTKKKKVFFLKFILA